MGPHPGRAAGRKAQAAFVLGGKSSSDTLPNGGGLETASCCPERGQHLPPGSDLGSMVSNRTLFPKSPLPRAAKGFSCSTQGRLDPASAPLLLLSPTHQRAGSLGCLGFFSPFPFFSPFSEVTSLPFPLCAMFLAAAMSQPRQPLAIPTPARRPGESGTDQRNDLAKPPGTTNTDPASFFKNLLSGTSTPQFSGWFYWILGHYQLVAMGDALCFGVLVPARSSKVWVIWAPH